MKPYVTEPVDVYNYLRKASIVISLRYLAYRVIFNVKPPPLHENKLMSLIITLAQSAIPLCQLPVVLCQQEDQTIGIRFKKRMVAYD